MKDEDRKNPYVMVGRYMGLAVLLPASTAVGYVIGYFLDQEFNTRYLKFAGLALGIVGGFVQLIRELLRDTKTEE